MNIAIKKLAMLEQTLLEREFEAKISGYECSYADAELKSRIAAIMDKIRY
ncbi:MAG: hypothetical protein MJ237_05845 [bacterium]|nr:hypothetical protein [bacterium]